MIKQILFVLSIILIAPSLFADDIDSIENLFDADESREEKKAEAEANEAVHEREKPPEVQVNKLENLNQLKSFEDVAVIQKRYLPKTHRFEGNINAAANINDSFFSSYGLGGGLTYNFNERWSVEGILRWFSVSNSKAANQLLERGVVTNGMVSTKLFYGLDLRWTPIYGKFSYFDKKIIPFDHYFSIGIGQTQLETGSSSNNSNIKIENLNNPITLRISTGEVFALTKWMAFRWDVSWHFMKPDVRTTKNSVATVTSDIQNNLFINFGLSFFFPEAKYR
ncbi:MAG: outer membrane beta-barrel domain-containing protein [Bdellovibrionaceae bacterium]|nr:outer membrane beta-barrel domain-containing protein [Pseudobdellovibrionaceae bacterium]